MSRSLFFIALCFACTPNEGNTPSTPPVDTDTDVPTKTDTDTPVSDDVTIYRDERGVPHIRADTDTSAMYGLGYASAQDRLAQMNLYVRNIQGRMSEIMGSEHLDADKQVRLIGYWRHAQEMAAVLPQSDLDLLQAYADGVNAYVAENPDALPDLFDTLGFEPQEWTPAHSLACWYRVSNLFNGLPFSEAKAYYDFKEIETRSGTEAAVAETLDGIHPGDPSAGVVQASDVPQDVQDAIADYAFSHGYGQANLVPTNYGHTTPKFSHAWVISGDRSTTGKAVLVSDPQTHVTAPAIWYEWQVTGETLNVRGVGLPGTPALLIGFNDHVAWGLTAAGIDMADVFRMDMVDADTYQIDGVSYDIETEVETIEVSDGPTEQVTWRSTVHGPLVTELIPANQGDEWAFKGAPIHRKDGDTFSGSIALMRATDIDAVRDAVDDWHYPSANLLVGAESGDIFYTVLGDIPLRSPDAPLGGRIGQEGGTAALDWVDIIPSEFKPWVQNPARGSLLSGNHRVAGDWYPLPLGSGSGGAGHTIRSARISELVDALPQTVEPSEVLEAVQWDCVHRGRRDMVRIARHLEVVLDGRLSTDTLSFLNATVAWSAGGGSMETDVEAALLPFSLQLSFREPDTGPELQTEFGGGENGLNLFLDTHIAAIEADPTFVPSTEAILYVDGLLRDTWAETIPDGNLDLNALADTYEAMATRDITLFASPLTGLGIDVTGVTVTGPSAQCQDAGTIWSQQAQSYTHYVDFTQTATAVMPPGNSENPLSGWFENQQDDWVTGTLLPAPLAPEIPTSGTPVIVLTP